MDMVFPATTAAFVTATQTHSCCNGTVAKQIGCLVAVGKNARNESSSSTFIYQVYPIKNLDTFTIVSSGNVIWIG